MSIFSRSEQEQADTTAPRSKRRALTIAGTVLAVALLSGAYGWGRAYCANHRRLASV